MMRNKEQTLLKGTSVLPKAVSISSLIANRAKEIQELEKLAAQSTSTKLVFQRLPKHLRRRAMSQNVKRLPRIYREAHMKQMIKSGLSPKHKRPSRKFRRRPCNLLEDYNRRQKKHVWLETHIWHAKRFQMINRWGYRVPFKPNDKAFRACYRASAHHCLMQDISYIDCVEITGLKAIIIHQLKLITNPNTGLTFGAKVFVNGSREGDIIVYQKGCYPYGAIGQIKFIWKSQETDDKNGCLWLWIHPAFYTELIYTLIDIFELEESQTDVDTLGKIYTNNLNGTKLAELKHSLNRFRLTGPLAHSVVKKLDVPSESNVTPWFVEYLQKPENNAIFNEQSLFWKNLNRVNAASELSPHIILNLIVTDPRYTWPAKRTKAIKQNDDDDNDPPIVPKSTKSGIIWDPKLRTEVSKNVLSTSDIIESRRNNLVPPQTVPLDATTVPVMLIQQPGTHTDHIGYSSGWDIILPSNWGRPFWYSFIMWGARAGGVKESNLLQFEQGIPDLLHPDTKSGETEENLVTEMHREKYFSLPPKKRTNYTKFGIACPFHFAWKTLISEWNEQKTIENFYVLRDRSQLKLLQDTLCNKNIIKIEANFEDNCLVPVKLTLCKRGKVGKFGIICLPQENDYENVPVEPLHKDQNQKLRKVVRDAHRKLLLKMKRQRIRAREKGKEPVSSKQIIEEYLEKMRSLWLPKVKDVRNSCSREVFGFVTSGDFCFSIAKGQCVGYIAIGALPFIFKKKQKDIVLVRDTKNKQYKLAKMEIIC